MDREGPPCGAISLPTDPVPEAGFLLVPTPEATASQPRIWKRNWPSLDGILSLLHPWELIS